VLTPRDRSVSQYRHERDRNVPPCEAYRFLLDCSFCCSFSIICTSVGVNSFFRRPRQSLLRRTDRRRRKFRINASVSSPQGSFARQSVSVRRGRCGAPASELFQGKTAYGAFPHECQRPQEAHRAIAEGLCCLCRHAPFRIEDDIRSLFGRCNVLCARQLESQRCRPRTPRKNAFHPACL